MGKLSLVSLFGDTYSADWYLPFVKQIINFLYTDLTILLGAV